MTRCCRDRENDDTKVNDDECVEGRAGDVEPRNLELKEVKVALQAPLKASSRFGSMTDVSGSFLFVASDRQDPRSWEFRDIDTFSSDVIDPLQ